jgi:two-component system sensor histidine kinase QseC
VSSLRARLTFWLVATSAVLMLGAGAALYAGVRSALVREFDEGLRARARGIASLLRIERDGRYDLDVTEGSMSEYLPSRRAEYFQINFNDGRVLARSESLQEQDLANVSDPSPFDAAHDIPLPDGRRGRAVAIWSIPEPEEQDRAALASQLQNRQQVHITVARARTEIDRALSVLLSSLLLTALVLAAATLIAVRLIVSRGLKPVGRMADQAASIGPENLDFRFGPTDGLPDELRPIAVRLNDLLGRLDRAFRRERRLNADIAHELRTPIAELRSLSEVSQRPGGLDPAAGSAYFRDVHEIALRMESTVQTLLALARSQSNRLAVAAETFELRPLISSICDRSAGEAGSKRLTVDLAMLDEVSVRTDRSMLAKIFENLISNAIAYSPTGGRVLVDARPHPSGACELVVANSNDSLVAEDLPHMFEPFWQKDRSRTNSAHAGLGLALVAEYAKRLDMNVEQRLVNADWFVVTLTIAPASSPATEVASVAREKHHVPIMATAENPTAS